MRFIYIFSIYWALFAGIILHHKYHIVLLTGIGSFVTLAIAAFVGCWLMTFIAASPITNNYKEVVDNTYYISAEENGEYFSKIDDNDFSFKIPEDALRDFPHLKLFDVNYVKAEEGTIPKIVVSHREYENSVLHWLFDEVYLYTLNLHLDPAFYDEFVGSGEYNNKIEIK